MLDLDHPVLGPIGGLRAIADIEPDEEIAPKWYQEEYKRLLNDR